MAVSPDGDYVVSNKIIVSDCLMTLDESVMIPVFLAQLCSSALFYLF